MLTGFQLRAARAILSLYAKDVAGKLGLHPSTLIRLEDETSNLSYLKCNLRTSVLLINFFESNQIFFPSKNSIGIKNESTVSNDDSLEMNLFLTKFQLKVSRIAMRLTQKSFGEYVGLPQSTLSELETLGKIIDFIKCDADTTEQVKQFISSHGIVFPSQYTIELIDDPVLLLGK